MARGNYLPVKSILRMIELLSSTDLAFIDIAERMGCSKSTVISVNRRFQVRRYNGKRSRWHIGANPNEIRQ